MFSKVHVGLNHLVSPAQEGSMSGLDWEAAGFCHHEPCGLGQVALSLGASAVCKTGR